MKEEKIVLLWTECSADENITFNTIEDLQKYIKNEYLHIDDVPTLGYDKHKININDKVFRLDVGTGTDFNPFTNNLRSYLEENCFIVY